ncbi:ATP-binding protein [Haloarchaeobius sp. DFWS5]|uniref:sensor histidine kinase n=1 Tax=Haloarchaeobius sp. DFWS5 TaxID=3446114 RepID=UPI003EB81B64
MVASEAESILDSLPGAVLVFDDELTLVGGNDSSSVVFGTSVDELVGDSLDSLVESGLFVEGTASLFESARSVLNEGDTDGASFRTGICHGNGPAQRYEVNLSPYVVDGERAGTVWSLRDVGTRQRYEETVEALHRATRTLMAADSLTEVYAECGRAANEILGFPGVGVREYDADANELCHVTFGAAVDDIETRPPYAVDGTPHGVAFTSGETVVDDIEEGDPFEREAFTQAMYVPLGEYGVIGIGKIAGSFDDTDIRFAEILAENTTAALNQVEQKERLRANRKQLERQNERLDEFAGVVAHDLQNPLNVATGSFEMFVETGDESYAEDVRYGHRRIRDIVGEVLTLARDGRTVDEFSQVLIADTARMAWGAVATEDASLSVQTDLCVEADQSRLQQLFENLFRNAIVHGGDVSEIRVGSLGEVRTDAPAAGFYVADDGVGIPVDERDAVFEPGYTTSAAGTGLGLAIVTQIAEAHSFDLSVTESETGGVRIEVTGVSVVEG